MTRRYAVLIAVFVAVAVYANAYGNRWALDDHALVANNPAAQSIHGALQNFFAPYWPPDEIGRSAGLYRPLTVLSFAVDWTISDGDPAWFHITNVLLHAFATALVVLVILAWVKPKAALIAGLVFAVHPVHVEAVANVIGRAEILSTIGILGAVLAARRYRAARDPAPTRFWLAATVMLVLFGMLSKENGIVAVAVLALDHALDPAHGSARNVPLYLGVGVISLAWFFIWRSVAGGVVDFTVAPAIRWLAPAQRLATALPVQLDVVRLLVWPMNLAASYDPQLIPRRLEFGPLAFAGAALATAITALGLLSFRRAPAVCFGLLAGLIAYAPTSNIAFGAGLMLGERTLYFTSIAPAVTAAWLYSVAPRKLRRGVGIVLVAILLAFAVRTYTRTPFWRDMRSVITGDMIDHPEGFRTQLRIGEAFEALGDSARALQHYLTSAELFRYDPFAAGPIVRLALALDRTNLALAESARAYRLAPFHPDLIALYARTLVAAGLPDSALTIAREGYDSNPGSPTARLYVEVLEAAGIRGWRKDLARARLEWLSGRPGAATAILAAIRLDAIGTDLDRAGCREIAATSGIIGSLDPGLSARLESYVGGGRCRSPIDFRE